jgi:hypothetical protein
MGEIAPRASFDPEDYFNRLSPALNLFKIVEQRYKKESIQWSQQALDQKIKDLKKERLKKMEDVKTSIK